MSEEVKAAMERLSGVWTVGYVEDNCRERLVNDVYTLLSDHARLSAEAERLSTPGLPEPQDAEVQEAVEYLSSGWGEGSEVSRFKRHVDTLIRAVQSPRLTGERLEAVLDFKRNVVMRDGGPNEQWAQIPEQVWLRLCAAFPELAE